MYIIIIKKYYIGEVSDIERELTQYKFIIVTRYKSISVSIKYSKPESYIKRIT